jgi:hypothetical protein
MIRNAIPQQLNPYIDKFETLPNELTGTINPLAY